MGSIRIDVALMVLVAEIDSPMNVRIFEDMKTNMVKQNGYIYTKIGLILICHPSKTHNWLHHYLYA